MKKLFFDVRVNDVRNRSSRPITGLAAAAAALAATAFVTLPAQAAITTHGYAYVNHAGVVSNASGISQANVVTAGSSSYCFKGLSLTPNNIQVTLNVLDNAGVNATIASAALGSGGGFTGCPTGTQAYVVTVTPNFLAAKNGFFVLIH